MERELDQLILAVGPQSTAEEVLTMLGAIKAASERQRERQRIAEQVVCGWIEEHGDLEVGDTRYYVGTEKRTKDVDVARTFDVIVQHAEKVTTEGEVVTDWQAIKRCLSTGAFKPATTKELIGDEAFERCFEVTTVQDLKTGKPKRGLRTANDFTRKAMTQ